ncbi:hypothetical protein [Halorhodospira neutriphila]|uniref:NfeD-like C-terminal domain-containing protein n=1 Tax=Halorhodospira neutriphila TaxID=168379 RepID=A0ABS1E1T2_9GAMM|nr:hypothetical protein [Halorhodospira neutriphila]MBK1725751.1 hypothetical protein [Halorhodospira neutriphila]
MEWGGVIFPVWLLWLAAAAALALADLALLGGQLLLVAAGLAALIAAAAAALGAPFVGQVWLFLGGTAVFVPALIFGIPGVRRRWRAPGDLDGKRGETVTVVAQGDRLVGKLKSDRYPIQLIDGSTPEEGEELVVDRMEGITLFVERPRRGAGRR